MLFVYVGKLNLDGIENQSQEGTKTNVLFYTIVVT